MTRAEYLEHVQEHCGFASTPEEAHGTSPACTLRDTPEVCRALERAHAKYCAEVEAILFPERAVEVAAELRGSRA